MRATLCVTLVRSERSSRWPSLAAYRLVLVEQCAYVVFVLSL